ncbi:DAK2 domain-containing protein [Chloroflexota bacterium]
MKQRSSIGGQDLREMFAEATSWLEKNSAEIDALNVFPVPDGDTGTNMLLTMRSTMEESYRAPDHSAAGVAQAMAKGALMGARGNSGVILSQIWRGLAQGLADKESLGAAELAGALQVSAEIAYKGISNPVEGTILTVIREASAAAQEQVSAGNDDLISVMEATVNAAGESVANTPGLLKVLKDAGVVDAGGQGLYTILEGSLRYLSGEAEKTQFKKPQIIVSELGPGTRLPQTLAAEEIPFGYCTEFLLKGEKLQPDKIRKHMEKEGESLIVVGDDTAVRVHIHTAEPGKVVQYATKLGTVHQASMRNMDEQHQDWVELQKDRMPAADTAIIAVVSGDGITDVFTSLGVALVVPGGQTMNPSTKDILQAVETVGSEKIIILPNNQNIVMTANQVQSLTTKTVEVVPTETIPQGVAALLAFDYEADLPTNTQIMLKAISATRTIEVTRSVRSTQVGDLKIKKKQPIGLLDGELVVAGNDNPDVIIQTLGRIDLDKAEVITIYYGADIEEDKAEGISTVIREKYPELQIEVVRGGQPHYDYIISVE